MTIINPQVALKRRDDSVEMLNNTLFEAVTQRKTTAKAVDYGRQSASYLSA